MGFRHALGMNISEMFRGKQHERSCDLTFLGHHLCTTPSRRIVLLIRFWHPELPVERWRDTLDAGMEDFAAMLRRRVSPPANAAVAEAWWRPPIGGMGERWSRPCSQSIITYLIVNNFPPPPETCGLFLHGVKIKTSEGDNNHNQSNTLVFDLRRFWQPPSEEK